MRDLSPIEVIESKLGLTDAKILAEVLEKANVPLDKVDIKVDFLGETITFRPSHCPLFERHKLQFADQSTLSCYDFKVDEQTENDKVEIRTVFNYAKFG